MESLNDAVQPSKLDQAFLRRQTVLAYFAENDALNTVQHPVITANHKDFLKSSNKLKQSVTKGKGGHRYLECNLNAQSM